MYEGKISWFFTSKILNKNYLSIRCIFFFIFCHLACFPLPNYLLTICPAAFFSSCFSILIFIHLFNWSLIDWFIYLIIYSFIYLFIYIFTYLFTYLFIYKFIALFFHLFIYLFIYILIHLFIYLFIYLFIHSFFHLFIYVFFSLPFRTFW